MPNHRAKADTCMEQKQTHASKRGASVLAANSNGGESIPANCCGGMTSAVSFRQREWPVLLSASPGGEYLFPPLPVAERATCHL
jgi:hypothetical protein